MRDPGSAQLLPQPQLQKHQWFQQKPLHTLSGQEVDDSVTLVKHSGSLEHALHLPMQVPLIRPAPGLVPCKGLYASTLAASTAAIAAAVAAAATDGSAIHCSTDGRYRLNIAAEPFVPMGILLEATESLRDETVESDSNSRPYTPGAKLLQACSRDVSPPCLPGYVEVFHF